MISVVIATDESEQLLVPTLAALVPGAMAGVVGDVIIADAGSRDGTAAVADVAGCRFEVIHGPLAARLQQAAAMARAPWLMFLRPGSVPDVTWVDETSRFVRDVELGVRAKAKTAVFRRASAASGQPMILEAFALLAAAMGARPRSDQGLLISKELYDTLGGHRRDSKDPETELLRRIGRRRIALLRSSVALAR
jgi:glycosyltransferase involved in cell wall biosynthesis